MKKTIKTDNIVSVFRAINQAKLSKLDTAEKFAVIKAARAIKPTAANFDDFVKDAREKLEPDNFAEIQEKMNDFNKLTDNEKNEVNSVVTKLNQDLQKCAEDELNKEVEIEIEALSDEIISKLADSNDFTVETILMIQDVLGV